MSQILVIDDDFDILDALHFVLEDSGYVADTSQNGEDAEKLLTANKLPRLLILDVLLSGKDGRDICRKLKGNSYTKNMPVIMISAHPTVKQSVFEAGADRFIPKPFDIGVLIETVEKLLKID